MGTWFVLLTCTNFLEKLKLYQPKAVTFSTTDPKPQPLLSRPSLPPHLSRLYSIDNHLLSKEQLTSKCLYTAIWRSSRIRTFCTNNKSWLSVHKIVVDVIHYIQIILNCPDGCVSCDCCTNGILEVKCPYSFSNIHPCKIKDSSIYLQSKSTHGTCQPDGIFHGNLML
jgi:hypothetical protein